MVFNKELIEWHKPDIILEIRAERFLENNYPKCIRQIIECFIHIPYLKTFLKR